MTKNRINLIILGFILAVSSFIYIYKLNSIPSGFYVDEAVVAYNSYSILETGKDAFGQLYPVLFRLLGSYTPPLFIYLAVPLIKLFGMQITTFRIISGISALVSVVFFFLFIKKLKIFKSDYSYLVTAFFYAITPWLLFNARLGYEVTLAYSLFNIGIYFLYSSLEKPNNFIWATLFLSLSTYTAHTQRFLAPIFLLIFLLIFKKEVFKKQSYKFIIISLFLAIIVHIPHFTVIKTPAFWVKNERLLESGEGRIAKNIFDQTLSYLSAKNLFYEPTDIDKQHIVPKISVMYNWMVIPYFVGLYLLFYRRKERSIKFLLLLFFTSLIPAVLSGEFISIQRALPFLLPLSIVIGLGIDNIFVKFNRITGVILFLIVGSYSLLMLYRSYFILFPVELAEAWNYGYKELAYYITTNPDKHFVIDNSRNPRNYILLLYHLQYPPEDYQREVDPKYKIDYYKSLPPENEYVFSNIEVREIDWTKDSYRDQVIIGDPLSVSQSQATEHYLDKIYEIVNPRNNPILIFYQTNPQEKCKRSPNIILCDKLRN